MDDWDSPILDARVRAVPGHDGNDVVVVDGIEV